MTKPSPRALISLFDFYQPLSVPTFFRRIYGTVKGNEFTVTKQLPFRIRHRAKHGRTHLTLGVIPFPADKFVGEIFYKRILRTKPKRASGRFDCANHDNAGWDDTDEY